MAEYLKKIRLALHPKIRIAERFHNDAPPLYFTSYQHDCNPNPHVKDNKTPVFDLNTPYSESKENADTIKTPRLGQKRGEFYFKRVLGNIFTYDAEQKRSRLKLKRTVGSLFTYDFRSKRDEFKPKRYADDVDTYDSEWKRHEPAPEKNYRATMRSALALMLRNMP